MRSGAHGDLIRSAIKIVIVATAISSLAGCCLFNPAECEKGPPTSTAKPIGSNVNEATGTSFQVAPPPGFWYARLSIHPELVNESIGSAAAANFASEVKRVVMTDTDSVGVQLKSTAPVTLPTYIPFDWTYDDSAGPAKWKSNFIDDIKTPWVRIDGPTQFRYDLAYSAGRQAVSQIATRAGQIIVAASVIIPGAWVVTPVTAGLISQATQAADTQISNFLSQTINANVSKGIDPGAKQRAHKIEFVDASNQPFARLTITIEITNSLMLAPLSDSDQPPSDPLSSPPAIQASRDPLNEITTEGGRPGATLGLKLQSEANDALRDLTSSDPEIFRRGCRNLVSTLDQTANLNVFDRVVTLRKVLIGTQFQDRPALYNSGCIDEDNRAVLRAMKLDLAPIQNTVSFGSDDLDAVGSFLMASAVDLQQPVANKFESTVTLTDVIPVLRNTNIISEDATTADVLALIKTLKVKSFGCYSLPTKGQSRGRGMVLSHAGKDGNRELVGLEFYGTGDFQSKVQKVIVRPATPSEKICRDWDAADAKS